MFPERWSVETSTDEQVQARIEQPDGPFVVEATHVDSGWLTPVTRVSGPQRHRLATLVRPRLEEAVAAADGIVPRPH